MSDCSLGLKTWKVACLAFEHLGDQLGQASWSVRCMVLVAYILKQLIGSLQLVCSGQVLHDLIHDTSQEVQEHTKIRRMHHVSRSGQSIRAQKFSHRVLGRRSAQFLFRKQSTLPSSMPGQVRNRKMRRVLC